MKIATHTVRLEVFSDYTCPWDLMKIATQVTVRLEVFSDYTCPWCYVRRLAARLSEGRALRPARMPKVNRRALSPDFDVETVPLLAMPDRSSNFEGTDLERSLPSILAEGRLGPHR